METKVPIRGWVSDGYKDVSGEVSNEGCRLRISSCRVVCNYVILNMYETRIIKLYLLLTHSNVLIILLVLFAKINTTTIIWKSAECNHCFMHSLRGHRTGFIIWYFW